MSSIEVKPTNYIIPINMNGLKGRMLKYPSKKKNKQEILFIYGHHSSLERCWGIIQVLHDYGSVTMPDLPGFGGMDSFYKINKKPTIDNFAAYLASFIKMQYKKRKIVIVGMSYGFIVVTRMLQRYPHMSKDVKLLISLGGFADHDDFSFSRPRYYTYLLSTGFFSHRIPAFVFKNVFIHGPVIRAAYSKTHNAKNKFSGIGSDYAARLLMDVEIGLWKSNHFQTYAFTANEFFKFSNCDKQVDIGVCHVAAENDHFFDNNNVEQHMKVIFNDVQTFVIKTTNHSPSIIADKKAASSLVPTDLKKILRNLS